MNKRDEGVIQKVLIFVLIGWIVIGWCVLMNLAKAGLAGRYLEDCLMEANLAALIIDPYHYGSTGELILEDVEGSKRIFEEVLSDSLDNGGSRLGIQLPVSIQEFRIYQVTASGTEVLIYDEEGTQTRANFAPEAVQTAPDGTVITHSALYAKAEATVAFMFGMKLKAVKEHCVDVKSEVEDE